jgi:hypothetical protein
MKLISQAVPDNVHFSLSLPGFEELRTSLRCALARESADEKSTRELERGHGNFNSLLLAQAQDCVCFTDGMFLRSASQNTSRPMSAKGKRGSPMRTIGSLYGYYWIAAECHGPFWSIVSSAD